MHCAAWKFDCLGEERVLWLRSFRSTIWFQGKLWNCRESWKNHERAVQSQSWRNPKSFWVRFNASLNYYSVITISLLTSNNLSRSKIARIVQIVFSVQIFRKISLSLVETNFFLYQWLVHLTLLPGTSRLFLIISENISRTNYHLHRRMRRGHS